MNFMDSQTKKSQQSNNKNPKIIAEIQNIYALLGEGKFKEALEKINDCEKQNPNNENIQFNKVGLLIDAGFGLKDQNVIKRGINAGEKNLQNSKFKKY